MGVIFSLTKCRMIFGWMFMRLETNSASGIIQLHYSCWDGQLRKLFFSWAKNAKLKQSKHLAEKLIGKMPDFTAVKKQ